jgi:hypothetical protein
VIPVVTPAPSAGANEHVFDILSGWNWLPTLHP